MAASACGPIPSAAGAARFGPRRHAARQRHALRTAGAAEQGGLTRLREVQALLRLADTYQESRLERACALALTADGRMQTVRNILVAGLDRAQLELPPATSADAYLHGAQAIVGEFGR